MIEKYIKNNIKQKKIYKKSDETWLTHDPGDPVKPS
jgi:hypothetical protein